MVSRLGLASGYGISGAAVERAYHEFGINYFFWGNPRRKGMGAGLRNLVKTERDNIVIALQSYDRSGILSPRSVEKALGSLGTDYADILILGWFGRYPGKRVILSATKLKQDRKVRFIGMSGHNRQLFGKLARDRESPVDVFMCRYNAAHPGAEQDIFPYLPEKERPGVTTYTATSWRKLLKKKKMPDGEEPLSAADCYRFVLTNPHVDLCLIGPAGEEQMLQGLTALEKGPLSAQEMERIRVIGEYVHR